MWTGKLLFIIATALMWYASAEQEVAWVSAMNERRLA